MRIVYYCAQLYKLGGIERVTTLKVNYLAEQGHEVSVICKDQGSALPFYSLSERVKLYNLDMPDFDEERGLIAKILSKHRRHRKLKSRLSALLDRLKPDVVVSTMADYYPILPEINRSYLSVLEYHGGGGYLGDSESLTARLMKSSSLFRFFSKYCLRRENGWREVNPLYYDKCAVLSRADVQMFSERGFRNVSFIPNPNPLVASEPSSCLEKNVLSLGRFSHEKNFEELIDIWAIVHLSHPDWTLTIVGDGETKPNVLDRIRQLGLEDSVNIRNTTKDVVPYFHSSSIYALTSRFESFGMVLAESLYMGVPVCVYDCPGGARDVFVDGEEGFLIPYGDKEAFADRLSFLMSNEDVRIKMGQSAKAGAGRYSVSSIMDQWADLFGWKS